MVTPFAVRLAIRGTETAGAVAGGYSALSTAGSIVGTLATTFFLIPSYPVNALLLGLSASLLLCAAILMRDRASAAIALAAAAAWVFALLTQATPPTIGGEKILARRDTPYHHIVVTQLDSSRWMRFDALTQSGVNIAYPNRSLVGYDEALLASLAFRPGIRRVCVIGLGGGSFSRQFARLRPDAEIDTVEIDPVVRELALDYFLYRESDRVRTVIEDGRVFLSKPGPAYDLIVLDAFNSTGVPFHLTTREFFEVVRRRLSPDGIFAANFVGQLMGKERTALLGDVSHDPPPVRPGLRREPGDPGRPRADRGQPDGLCDRLRRSAGGRRHPTPCRGTGRPVGAAERGDLSGGARPRP